VSPGTQSILFQGRYATDYNRIDLTTNVAYAAVSGLPQATVDPACASTGDGRQVYFNTGATSTENEMVRVTSTVTTVAYTTSGGDGNYIFSLLSGGALGNFYPSSRMWIPFDTWPSGTATIQVQDGLAATATATATH
jgi:hypothetical protein